VAHIPQITGSTGGGIVIFGSPGRNITDNTTTFSAEYLGFRAINMSDDEYSMTSLLQGRASIPGNTRRLPYRLLQLIRIASLTVLQYQGHNVVIFATTNPNGETVVWARGKNLSQGCGRSSLCDLVFHGNGNLVTY
jgi:hypothetical protein